MASFRLIAPLLFFSLCTAAYGQSDQQLCKELDAGGKSLGFVVAKENKVVLPTHPAEPFDRPVTLIACIPVDQMRSLPTANMSEPGAINVRTQTIAVKDAKTSIEVKYDPANKRKWVSIDAYQEFHRCRDPIRSNEFLERDFHKKIGRKRTDEVSYRANFVFDDDVKAVCSMPDTFARFVSELLNPFSIGRAIGQTFDLYVDVSKIVDRSSVLLIYKDQSLVSRQRYYLTTRLPKLDSKQCIRVRAQRVFPGGLDEFGSSDLGYACRG